MTAGLSRLLAFALVSGCSCATFAQVSPEQSAALFKPAAGLEATLWACEPMLANPTNIDVDSRGRVWIAEGLNYRLGISRNARFHPIAGADRIKILEDTDGDGKADKTTVFADRIFPVPMGIAVEEHYDQNGKYRGCRVFVGNSPDLLVLEDRDGDDLADNRYPLLTGFGGVDSDHGLHGMALGLDGKLYFTHGDGCCSVGYNYSNGQHNFNVVDKSGRRVRTDQLATTLRANRDGTAFEIICDRQRNNYETCLNSFGNIFASDNDDDGERGCRVIWVMDGGHYGYNTLGSPRHWGEDVPGNVPKLVGTGNGSPCGIMVYEGELLPRQYRGALIEADAGTRQVNDFPLARVGASFRTEHKILLASDDPCFRPVDVCAAPDGSIFIADWYDAAVGGGALGDQTTGRIYRVAPPGKKSTKPKLDFATTDGLIAALKSPNVATQDAARRLLIERGRQSHDVAIGAVAVHDRDPIYRARALWVWHAVEGDAVALVAMIDMVNQGDPRIREQAVRILGRDCQEIGHVRKQKSGEREAPPALNHLDVLAALANDPDAGVRREVILALRNLPTSNVGNALRALTAAWDGRDRWYLEALGLALEDRESPFIARLCDGTLFGELDLARDGQNGNVAVPPFFPVDRNEAYIASGTADKPATALSKYLGLAWRLHCREAIPLLRRIVPHLGAVELQQAFDDIIEQMSEPEAGAFLAELALETHDSFNLRRWCATLARRLQGNWQEARRDPNVDKLILKALSNRETRLEGVALAVATDDDSHRAALVDLAGDLTAPEDVRVAAVEGLGSFSAAPDRLFVQWIAAVRGKRRSTAVAEAAVRAIARRDGAADRLTEVANSRDYPLGLRREALRALARQHGGGERVLALVKGHKLPEDLAPQAAALLYAERDPRLSSEAAAILPMPNIARARPLPPLSELVRREGNIDRGKDVFFRDGTGACAGCHRVRGRGQWIGPDLSTIGVKYGRAELIHSILSPNSAIGAGFRSVVAALSDGRVVVGLPVEESTDRLVLKTAEGERVRLERRLIAECATSDVSLMPEGLAQTMTEQEFIDLLAYLGTLRQPASILGQYWAAGPLHEAAGAPAIDPLAKLDPHVPLVDRRGRKTVWRRVTASAEGVADLSAQIAREPQSVAYAYTVVESPARQHAEVVLDTAADVTAWLNGKPVALSGRSSGGHQPRTAHVEMPRGASTFLIRVQGGSRPPAQVSLVTTFVSERPVGFRGGEAGLAAQTAAQR
jgi:putative membrane-bound dehydrogenase-like protein